MPDPGSGSLDRAAQALARTVDAQARQARRRRLVLVLAAAGLGLAILARRHLERLPPAPPAPATALELRRRSRADTNPDADSTRTTRLPSAAVGSKNPSINACAPAQGHINLAFENMAGTENQDTPGKYRHLLACLRITPNAFTLLSHSKAPK